MEKIEIKGHSKYFFLASFLLLVVISLVIIWPFFTIVLGSIVIAYVFYPVYKKLCLLVKNQNIASLLMSLFILALLIFPIFILANSLIRESAGLFYLIRNVNLGVEDLTDTFIFKYLSENVDIANYIKNALSKLSIEILQKTDSFVIALPGKIINIFVMFFMIFYLFKDGEKVVESIKRELPLKEKYKQDLIKKFSDTIYATVYGVLGAAFLQAAAALLGYYIFQANSPLFLAFLTFLAALIPFVGSALVWFPVAVIHLITGQSFNGIGLIIYGTLVIASIDNLIKPMIMGRKSNMHPVLALLGILGGLQVFGLIGIVIGPLSLAILLVFFDFYLIEKKEAQIVFKK
ncbi:MAG: AI-2E family transporter [Nanoarchaeota archaeon]